LATAVAERVSLEAETARLTIAAASSGTIVDLLPGLHPGDWLSSNEQLATIRVDVGPVIDAYVKESDLSRIKLGDKAAFYPDAADQRSLHCTVSFIDKIATMLLTDPELASTYGGGVTVRRNKHGLVPEGAVYRVKLVPHDHTVPRAQLRGKVQISGQGESLVARTARSIAAVVIREGGI
jgi:putative peptide zinc metalloprotease protein